MHSDTPLWTGSSANPFLWSTKGRLGCCRQMCRPIHEKQAPRAIAIPIINFVKLSAQSKVLKINSDCSLGSYHNTRTDFPFSFGAALRRVPLPMKLASSKSVHAPKVKNSGTKGMI